jgi:hypothetical protein
MTAELKLSDLFFQAAPSVAAQPHLITLLDGDLIGKVSQLTKSRPGLWPLPAPFDEQDTYNEVRESAKFADWGLALNQAEVQGVGRLIKDALFGTNLLLMSSAIDEEKIGPLAQTQGRRLENGAWFTPGYQDIPQLVPIIELAGWVLIPLGPGRSRALFAVASGQAAWLAGLQDWCDRQGRDVWRLARDESRGTVALTHVPAPARYRDNAIRHRIDAFIGEMELWYGSANGELAPRVQERVDFLGKLREDIARARQQ